MTATLTTLPTMTTNAELELAYKYVSETNRHIFLTGKAGTGKTTFLHRIRREIPKRMAVVAPTGVAAINAKGMTIHSLFQLPFGVLTPNRIKQEMATRRFSGKKMDLLRGLDLLVIDEISMVRADVLDAIDHVLKKYRRAERPFGGLQLLMIGDLHQLSPVVKNEDMYQLSDHYKTPYFFSCLAFQQAAPVVIQLTHIFRQSDQDFIKLLNEVRGGKMDGPMLGKLNERYQPDFTPDPEDGYITLASHNRMADRINLDRLKALKGKPYRFSAEVSGKFPESMYPNEEKLEFKVGAQVMFNRNDTGEVRAYYNGKIGTITAIKGNSITVNCTDGGKIEVQPVEWKNQTFQLDPQTKEIEEQTLGTYHQHPLRLAWAITIHKSQGLTFERVVIDAGAAFAHGQVYVALSRCKTFEGIVLSTPIEDRSVKTDRLVSDYSRQAEENVPTAADLLADKRAYQIDRLKELFDFKGLQFAGRRLQRTLFEHERSVQGSGLALIQDANREITDRALAVGNTFRRQLDTYATAEDLPTKNEELQDRLRKAAAYFLDFFEQSLTPLLEDFPALSDNKKIKQQIDERLEELKQRLFTKQRVFATVTDGFSVARYVKAKGDAAVDYGKSGKTRSRKSAVIPQDIPNRPLYVQIVEWRRKTSDETDVPPYTILPNGPVLSIAQTLPTTKLAFLAISGFGPKRYERYGLELLAMVEAYRLSGVDLDQPPPATVGNATQRETLELYSQGLSIEEIAERRGFVNSTIGGHIVFWIEQGEVPPDVIVTEERMYEIQAFLREKPGIPLSGAFKHFEGRFSYPELRASLVVMEKE